MNTPMPAPVTRRPRHHGALALGCVLALALALPPACGEPSGPRELVVGSKNFTESVVLGELVTQLGADAGAPVRHARQLGGTRLLWNALLRGELDVYPEYTGTITQEILAGEDPPAPRPGAGDTLAERLAAHGVRISAPIGFDNTYVLGMRRERAEQLGITSISDLRAHPDLALAFSSEFMDRGDGWPALAARYSLPHRDVRGLDHDLAYKGLEQGTIDVTDLYATDAEIRGYDLRPLRDDAGHFPEYQALLLFRDDVPTAWVDAFTRLENAISAGDMTAMNARVKLDGVPEHVVAADVLRERFGVTAEPAAVETWWTRLRRHTLEHLLLVGISLAAAIAVALPLGVLAARRPRLGQLVLGLAGVLQTIPSLALFVFMIPLLGIGGPPAVVALFLYSLLPVVRNTHAGLTGITPALIESARALGLPPHARLRLVELPLAAPSILAGIKTAAVINVGTATLGAFIGAGGYGQPIFTGIRLDDTGLILQGAVPAALLALVVHGVFELAERRLVPLGLRLARG